MHATTTPGLLGLLLLGIVQGLTEFLPVSSSGHLVVLQRIVEVGEQAVLTDLVLHVGTLVPALWFFRADVASVFRDAFAGEGPFLRRPGVHLAVLVLAATVPTAIIGLAFEDVFEALFSAPLAVAPAFLVTAGLLWATPRREDGTLDLLDVHPGRAALIGLAQGFAITPGISRSGTTIAVALLLGLRREVAIKLSFLMSVPAIVGALLLKSRDVVPGQVEVLPLVVGALGAAISGYLALAWLVKLVHEGGLGRFSYYLFGAALMAVAVGVFVPA